MSAGITFFALSKMLSYPNLNGFQTRMCCQSRLSPIFNANSFLITISFFITWKPEICNFTFLEQLRKCTFRIILVWSLFCSICVFYLFFGKTSFFVFLFFFYFLLVVCFKFDIIFKRCVYHTRCSVILFSLYKNYMEKQIFYHQNLIVVCNKNIPPEWFSCFSKISIITKHVLPKNERAQKNLEKNKR